MAVLHARVLEAQHDLGMVKQTKLREVCQDLLQCTRLYSGSIVICLIGASIAALLKAVDNYLDSDFLKDNILFEPEAYTSYTFLLGFMIAFRTNQAYDRYWEGCTLLQNMMGNWYDAASSLIAFCKYSDAHPEEIHEFQHVLVRLCSLINALIFCELAGEISEPEALKYNLLDVTSLDRETLRALAKSDCKPEMVFQKVQGLVVHNMKNGVLNIPPPILTRAFQEMSNAMLNFHEATKLAYVHFPASYISAAHILAVVHFFMTPIVVVNWTSTSAWAAAFCAIQIFIMCALLRLARTLDNPFNSSLSELKLEEAQIMFNKRLTCLIGETTNTKIPTLRKGLNTSSLTSLLTPSKRQRGLLHVTSVCSLKDIYGMYEGHDSVYSGDGAPDMSSSLLSVSASRPTSEVATVNSDRLASAGRLAQPLRRLPSDSSVPRPEDVLRTPVVTSSDAGMPAVAGERSPMVFAPLGLKQTTFNSPDSQESPRLASSPRTLSSNDLAPSGWPRSRHSSDSGAPQASGRSADEIDNGPPGRERTNNLEPSQERTVSRTVQTVHPIDIAHGAVTHI